MLQVLLALSPGGSDSGDCLQDVPIYVYIMGLKLGCWSGRWVRGIVLKPSYLLFSGGLLLPPCMGGGQRFL